MADIEEYASGAILEGVRKAELRIKALVETRDDRIRREIEEGSEDSRSRHFVAEMSQLRELIWHSSFVAVGPRICLEIHPKCNQPSESVFLDELAKALARVGKARETTREEAYSVLEAGGRQGHPHIVSVVSGKPLELCNSCKDCCILWQLERAGIEAIRK